MNFRICIVGCRWFYWMAINHPNAITSIWWIFRFKEARKCKKLGIYCFPYFYDCEYFFFLTGSMLKTNFWQWIQNKLVSYFLQIYFKNKNTLLHVRLCFHYGNLEKLPSISLVLILKSGKKFPVLPAFPLFKDAVNLQNTHSSTLLYFNS